MRLHRQSLTGGGVGGGGGTPAEQDPPHLTFTALQLDPPASAFATLDTRNSVRVLDFNDATDSYAIGLNRIPVGWDLTSGLKVTGAFTATSATSGDVRWGIYFERLNTDIDADSWDSVTALNVTTSGTSGIPTPFTITCTTIDGITAGDFFRVRVARIASDTGNDTMSGDAELIGITIEEV